MVQEVSHAAHATHSLRWGKPTSRSWSDHGWEDILLARGTQYPRPSRCSRTEFCPHRSVLRDVCATRWPGGRWVHPPALRRFSDESVLGVAIPAVGCQQIGSQSSSWAQVDLSVLTAVMQAEIGEPLILQQKTDHRLESRPAGASDSEKIKDQVRCQRTI